MAGGGGREVENPWAVRTRPQRAPWVFTLDKYLWI